MRSHAQSAPARAAARTESNVRTTTMGGNAAEAGGLALPAALQQPDGRRGGGDVAAELGVVDLAQDAHDLAALVGRERARVALGLADEAAERRDPVLRLLRCPRRARATTTCAIARIRVQGMVRTDGTRSGGLLAERRLVAGLLLLPRSRAWAAGPARPSPW